MIVIVVTYLPANWNAGTVKTMVPPTLYTPPEEPVSVFVAVVLVHRVRVADRSSDAPALSPGAFLVESKPTMATPVV